jgi:hypothetical protein
MYWKKVSVTKEEKILYVDTLIDEKMFLYRTKRVTGIEKDWFNLRREMRKLMKEQENDMGSIKQWIRILKEKMYPEDVTVRKLQNRNNLDIIDIITKLSRLTKYEAIKKVYHTIFKWIGVITTGKEQIWEAIRMD